MPTHASQDAAPSEDIAAGGPLTRRRFLTYVVAAPVLTVAACSAGALIAPGKAYAVVPSPPQPENILDLGDVMVAATKQAQEPAPRATGRFGGGPTARSPSGSPDPPRSASPHAGSPRPRSRDQLDSDRGLSSVDGTAGQCGEKGML